VEKIVEHEIPILSSSVTTVDTSWDLGVIVDRHLSTLAHVSSVCRSAYCFLHQLRQVVISVSVDAAKTVVQALISWVLQLSSVRHLRHPAPALTGRTECHATCLITGTWRCDHITPVFRQLHWLPVWQPVESKLTLLVYKALNNLAPPYLSDDCQLIATTGHHQLRSAEFQVHYHLY